MANVSNVASSCKYNLISIFCLALPICNNYCQSQSDGTPEDSAVFISWCRKFQFHYYDCIVGIFKV